MTDARDPRRKNTMYFCVNIHDYRNQSELDSTFLNFPLFRPAMWARSHHGRLNQRVSVMKTIRAVISEGLRSLDNLFHAHAYNFVENCG